MGNTGCCGTNMNMQENEALQQAIYPIINPEKPGNMMMQENNVKTLAHDSSKVDTSVRNLQARIEAGVFIHMLDESSIEPAARESPRMLQSHSQSMPLDQIDDDFLASAHDRGNRFNSNVSVDQYKDSFSCDISQLDIGNKL